MPMSFYGQSGHGTNIDLDLGKMLIAPQKPVVNLQWSADNDIELVLNQRENNQEVTLTLKPEPDITAREQFRLLMLTNFFFVVGGADRERPLQYIRKHNLERHFKFSATA